MQKQRKTLKKANFEIGEEKTEASENIEEGKIIRTDPDAGTGRKKVRKLIWLSPSGKQSFQIGNYIGKNQQMS